VDGKSLIVARCVLISERQLDLFPVFRQSSCQPQQSHHRQAGGRYHVEWEMFGVHAPNVFSYCNGFKMYNFSLIFKYICSSYLAADDLRYYIILLSVLSRDSCFYTLYVISLYSL